MMKENSKILALILVLLTVTAMLFAGCNKQENTPDSAATEETSTVSTEKEVDTTESTDSETEPSRKPGVYRVTILPTANGTVTANCTEAKKGEKITLSVTPDAGYELTTLIVNNRHGEVTFEMPAEDVMVYARFGYPKGIGDARLFPNGDFFGSAGKNYSSDVLDMTTDRGQNPYLVMDANKGTPLFAYVKGFSTRQFYLELTAKVTGIRSDEKYPKFGLLTNDGNDMVKFYLDMSTDQQVLQAGAVHQKNGASDDWAGQTPLRIYKALNLKEQSVKLGLLRDGKSYYFYVNDRLVATGNDLSELNTATGIFSFGTSLKITDYMLIKREAEMNILLSKAKADAEIFRGPTVSENFFNKTSDGVYTLNTKTDAGHLVDDVMVAGQTMRESYYSMKGKLTLTNAGEWGQSRILISGDADNEHCIALEKLPDGNYQIFTMSNASENEWTNWTLIVDGEQNGRKNSMDFEIVVIENQLYLVIEDKIYYTGNRVTMPESTVKFSGINVGTTTVEGLSMEVFADEAAAKAYVETKQDRFGENFGVSQQAYWTSTGVDLTNDKGENPTIKFVGGAPQYAYWNEVFTDKFCFETEINVEVVLNSDAYPKFGMMIKDSKEMVKFFVDMNDQMTATHVGVVYQPNDGTDEWSNSVSAKVDGMSFSGSDTLKLKLVRDGKAYYFYVNDELVLYNEDGFQAESGAVGVFSFNAAMTASEYKVMLGADADNAIRDAQNDVAAMTRLGLTCNWFNETENGIFTLTTDSGDEHKVDDLTRGGDVLRTAYYSLKGKLTLTDAGEWGQSRILISGDSNNEHVIALEKLPDGNYQIFTMSNANEGGWNNWTLIKGGAENGSKNSLDYEVIVIGKHLYFIIDGKLCYSSSRVSMTESTVKFSGVNTGTTTLQNLAVALFENEAAAKSYVGAMLYGENFGESQGSYITSTGVDLSYDRGVNPTIRFVGAAPQYAYLNDVFTDTFCFETRINVDAVLNNDGYPKFGLMVHDGSEMVKFFVDMTPAMTATHVGVVYQPNGGGDDWAHSVSAMVDGMRFTGSDTVKLKLVRNGTAYYFYVNDQLVLQNPEGFKAQNCAVGIFSFNTELIASDYNISVEEE